MPDLDHLQREFFKALLLPLRGASRASTDLSESDEGHSPEFFRIADEIVKPGPSLSSAERLELYHRQYWFRILDSIAEDFPVLRRMAGEGLFWNLVEAYLLRRPSRSFTLRHLGEAFAEFITSSDLLDGIQREWFEAVARIEYARMVVFEAAQGAVPEPVDLQNEEIDLQEHLVLLHLPVPADLCWDWPDFTPAATTPRGETDLAVWRDPSGQIRHERLDPAEVPLLARLRGGIRLADLFENLPPPSPSEEQVGAWFAKWHGHRWLGVRGREGELELDTSAGWDGMDRMSSQAVRMD
jgi:hypothetical protein